MRADELKWECEGCGQTVGPKTICLCWHFDGTGWLHEPPGKDPDGDDDFGIRALNHAMTTPITEFPKGTR